MKLEDPTPTDFWTAQKVEAHITVATSDFYKQSIKV